ncbi:MAG: acylphosphatase [Candidatus Electryonea clarkiae]|nr:acylphosphatase [Candidatus Electryonea clarkiae]MDP8288193.1 acylphosphatase [Candidatus Electryonea clarkiae]
MNSQPEIKRLHAIVSGRVQGVSFRWFVRKHARPLRVNGWVRNLSDGTVEVLAEGEKDNLQTLLDYLRQGPYSSIVRNIDIIWSEPEGIREGFDITY